MLVDPTRQFLHGLCQQEKNDAGASGQQHNLQEFCGHRAYVIGIEATGNQSGDNAAECNTEKPETCLWRIRAQAAIGR